MARKTSDALPLSALALKLSQQTAYSEQGAIRNVEDEVGNHSLTRFLAALLTGILMLGMILGSMQLTEVDPKLAWVRPTRVSRAPTTTPFPTAIPDTPVATSTPVPTLTPRSVLVDVCEPPSGWRPYVIRPGDTLARLAARLGVSLFVLMRENCLGSAEIQAGDVIHLPPGSEISPPTPVYTCGPPWDWKLVRVQPGDTLYSLARRYGTTIRAIRQANCMQDYTIYIGSQIYLPPKMVIIPTPSPTASPTQRPSATPTMTPSTTASPTLEISITPTPVPTITITATVVPTQTITVTLTSTPTPSEPVSPTLTHTPTPSPSPTASGTITTTTPLPTLTPTPTTTSTPGPTATSTATPTEGQTPTSTTTSSASTPTETRTPSTPTFTPTPRPASPKPTTTPIPAD